MKSKEANMDQIKVGKFYCGKKKTKQFNANAVG
jgi:hypothetical protein